MAKVLEREKKTTQKNKMPTSTKGILIGFGVAGILFPVLWILAILIALSYYFGENDKRQAGREGEEIALEMLKTLPDTFTIIPTVEIDYEGRLTELDNVIIHKNGIFVVEVKHNNGVIEYNGGDPHMVQHKTGRKGGQYQKTFNPIGQAKRQVFLFSKLNKEHKVKSWIEPLILFTNKNSTLAINNPEVPCFRTAKEVKDFVELYNPKYYLTEEEIEKYALIIREY